MGIWQIIGLVGFGLLIACILVAAFIVSSNLKKLAPLTDADAMKFAELLVAEFKLSNPKKTEQGMAGKNLHQVFHKEIARAGRAYKDRVSDPEQFRYFEEALVNVLAEGDKQFLGKGHFRNFG